MVDALQELACSVLVAVVVADAVGSDDDDDGDSVDMHVLQTHAHLRQMARS